MARTDDAASAGVAVNEVRLAGRVSQDPERRELPSGDEVWTFRLVVARPEAKRRGRTSVDALECSAWSGRTRRAVRSWRAGDLVEVDGAVRRRFYRTGAGAASVVEVEVERARVIRRAASA